MPRTVQIHTTPHRQGRRLWNNKRVQLAWFTLWRDVSFPFLMSINFSSSPSTHLCTVSHKYISQWLYRCFDKSFRMCVAHFLGLNKSFIFISTALSLHIWKSYQFMPISSENRPRFILSKTPKISVFQCQKITLSITVPLFDRTQDFFEMRLPPTLNETWEFF